jgi:uncharacterized SAM-binding protein YcdF (DUF218 family)
MLFWLKKAVSFWLMPLPFCLGLMAVGLWLVLRSAGQPATRSRWLGRSLLGAGAMLLLLFGNPMFSQWLVRPLEAHYPAIPEIAPEAVPTALARCRYVVVLGGGHTNSAKLPATSQLSPHSLGRLAEGVRLLRLLPDARLIVSGPGTEGQPTHASVLAQAAIALGVDPGRISKIEQARDTEEEGQAVRGLTGDAPVALVTSAWHLPRAIALFRDAGVDVLPCPSDYLSKPTADWSLADLLWDSTSLDTSTWAVRERIGALWLRLRGKN